MATVRTAGGTLGRLWLVDGLRGVAALAVMAYHYLYRAPELYPELGSPVQLARFGQYGVVVFFVISGVVVTQAALRTTTAVFALRRVIRLWPAYLLGVVVTHIVVTIWGLPGREVSHLEAVANATMLQQWFGVRSVDGVYWTLGVELLFYVIVAAFARLGLMTGHRVVVAVGLWMAAAVAAHAVLAEAASATIQVWGTLIGWTPPFAVGVGIALWLSGQTREAIWVAVMAVVATTAIDSSLFLVIAVCAVLVTLCVFAPTPSRLLGPARFLGETSYPLYLMHQNIGYVALLALAHAGVTRSLAVGLVAVGAVALSGVVAFAYDVPVRSKLTSRFRASGVR